MAHIPPSIVDFHVHLFPDRMFDAVWKYFTDNYRWDVIYRMYAQECLRHLRERGVDTVVFSNYAHRRGVAGPLNEWNARILDEHDGLYCFAAYHPDDDDALTIAEKALAHPKVLGFKLQLLVQRFHPHDERLYPLYEMVRERGKRILFHAGTGPAGNEFTGIAHFRKMMDDFPNLDATVAHMGALEYREFMESLDEYPGLYLDTAFAFYPELGKSFDLGASALETRADRVVYGSDFPNLIFPREHEIDAIANYGLSDRACRMIFSENGRELIRRATVK